MAVCELLYAGALCITAVSGGPTRLIESDVRVEVWGVHPTSGARLEAKGWHALAINGTDVLSTVNPKSLSEACADGACVRYHQFCEPELMEKRECIFSIVRPGQNQPFEVRVTAYGAERWQAATRSLYYVTQEGRHIPLEAMIERSSRESPYCARIRRPSEGPMYEPDCDFLNH